MPERSNRFWIAVVVAAIAGIVLAAVGLPAAYRVYHERRVADLEVLARACLAEGKDDQAAAVLEHYLRYRPQDTAAHADHARLRFEQSRRPGAARPQFEKAQSAISAALSKNPDDLALRRRLAITLLSLGQFGAARTELADLREKRAAAAAGPDTDAIDVDELTLLEARARAGNGEMPEAIALAAGLVGYEPEQGVFSPDHRPGPHEADASLLLSALLVDRQDEAAAGRVLERLATTAPADVRTWLTLARWHASHGDPRRAEDDVARAREIAPDEPEVLGTAFAIALSDGRIADAGRLAEAWREKFPDSAEAHVAVAVVARREGDADREIATLREGLAKIPGHPLVATTLGEALLRSGNLAEAETEIADLSEKIGPGNPVVGMLEARLLLARQRWLPAQKRLEALRPLVAQSPDMKRQVDMLLAACHARLGQFDEQLAASQRVLGADHTSLVARLAAAEALASAGKPAEALAAFEAVAAALPAGELAGRQEVWAPLLRLRVAAQARLPAADRDWSAVDGLLAEVAAAGQVPPVRLAVLRHDVLVAKEERAAANAALEAASAAHPDDYDLFERRVVVAIRDEGRERAVRMLDEPPPALADDPRLLVLRARLAVRAPPEEAAATLDALEAKIDALPAEQTAGLPATVAAIRALTGDRAGAERIWKTMLERNPDDLQTRFALFETACLSRDVARAQEMAEDIGSRCGATSPQARAAKAATILMDVTAARRGVAPSAADAARLAEVRDLLKAAEAERPGWATIQQLFADLELARGDLPAAIDRLRRTAELRPDDLSLTARLAATLLAANRAAEARSLLDGVGRELPPGLQRLSAQIDLAAGRPVDAVALAERAVGSGRGLSPEDLGWFAELLARAGKPAAAAAGYEKLVAASPDNPGAWNGLVATHFAARNTATAKRVLERAGQALETPNRELVLAAGQELLGSPDDAEAALRAGLGAAPGSRELKAALADLLARRGRFNDARGLLEELADSDDDAEGAFGAAQARRALLQLAARDGSYGDVERALAVLERNRDADGNAQQTDIALKAGILSQRPEPRAWKQAVAQFELLSQRRRLSTAERMQRVRVRDRMGLWDDCRKELLELVAEPDVATPVLALAVEKLVAHGDLAEAASHLAKLAERAPDSTAVAALEARLAVASKDRAAALAAARRLTEGKTADPDTPERQEMVAGLLEELGFDRAADEAFSKLAALSPAGLVARAQFLGRRQRGGEALDLLDEAQERLAPAARARAAVAVLRADGSATPELVARVDAAVTAARRADPDDFPLAMAEAEMRTFTGRRDDAVAIYRRALEDSTLSRDARVVAQNNLAMLLAQRDTAGEARRLIDAAIDAQGPHPSLLDTQGVVMLAEGSAEEAIGVLREALLDPSPEKHLHLACALAARKRFEAARGALADARKLGLDPRRLDADDRARLESLEKALAAPAS
jgi:predicted Zn-dependent protease